MHWVAAEAIGAAAALHHRTGDQQYARWYDTFWDYATRYLLDLVDGSWRHELDHANQPAATVWPGKPDLYHAVQATLLPLLPLAPAITRAVADGLLDAGTAAWSSVELGTAAPPLAAVGSYRSSTTSHRRRATSSSSVPGFGPAPSPGVLH
jgi:hypothetical protein